MIDRSELRLDIQTINCSATADSLGGMLLGRFLVGTTMGVSPSVAAYRGTKFD